MLKPTICYLFLSIYSFSLYIEDIMKPSLQWCTDVKLNSLDYVCTVIPWQTLWQMLGYLLLSIHDLTTVIFITRKYFSVSYIQSLLQFLDRFSLISVSLGTVLRIFQFKSSLCQCRKKMITGTLATCFLYSLGVSLFPESTHSLLCCFCHAEVLSCSSLPHWFSICFNVNIFLVTYVHIWCKYATIQSGFTLSVTISRNDLL